MGAKPGSKPKPTALKLLQGCRSDRINREEPPAQVGQPPKPELSAQAGAEWDRLAPRLAALGVLTLEDGEALARMCGLLATAAQIEQEKGAPEFRLLIMEPRVDPDGGVTLIPRENPLIRMERQVAQALRPYFAMFGLEPSSRSRLKASGQPHPQDKLSAFLLKTHA